ncbi:restriction endonuclease subunit S [Lachnospiraceae bacterium 29-91]
MNKCKLGDLLTIKHGFPFKGEYFSDKGEYIVLTPGNFYETGGFKRILGKEKYYLGIFPEEYLCKKGDFIVAMTQQAEGLLGSTAFVPEDDIYLHNQRIGLISVNEQKADKYYLDYLFRTNEVRKQIRDSATGSKVKHTSPDRIYDVEVYIHDLETQKRIGALLHAIDSKILYNNKTCLELESMAKTIYDYWFLQFEFPNEDGKPYKSSGGKMVWDEELKREIPEGWEVADLKDIAFITMGTSPKGDSINTNGDGIVFYQGKADFGNRFPITRTYTEAPIRYAAENDILLSVRAPVGTLNIANERCCIGRGLAAIHSKCASFIFYLMLANQYKFDIYNNGGTTFGAITKEDLFGMRIVVPKEDIIDQFEKKVNCMDRKIFKGDRENQELISLREFLLPLLMNGQVGFKD